MKNMYYEIICDFIESRLGLDEHYSKGLGALLVYTGFHKGDTKAKEFLKEFCKLLDLEIRCTNNLVGEDEFLIKTPDGDSLEFCCANNLMSGDIYSDKDIRDYVLFCLFEYCTRCVMATGDITIPLVDTGYLTKEGNIISYYYLDGRNKVLVGSLSIMKRMNKHVDMLIKVLEKTSFKDMFDMEDDENEEN